MSILAWVFLGLVSGFIASKIAHHKGVLLDLALGVSGAFLGGWFFIALGSGRFTQFHLGSLFTAGIGAVITLMSARAIMRQSTT